MTEQKNSSQQKRTYLTESLATREESFEKDGNFLARLLMVIGILIICLSFFLTGYFIKVNSDFSWLQTLYWLGGGIICGLLFIGISEIIRLLNNLNNKL